MKKYLAAVMTLALVTSGCASIEYGKPVAKDSLSRVQKGKTTKQEVIEIFGQPQSTNLNMDGGELLTYSHTSAEGKVSPAAFIPLIGLFFMKTKGSSQGQHLQFLVKDNVVTNYSYSESGGESETGLLGTKMQSR